VERMTESEVKEQGDDWFQLLTFALLHDEQLMESVTYAANRWYRRDGQPSTEYADFLAPHFEVYRLKVVRVLDNPFGLLLQSSSKRYMVFRMHRSGKIEFRIASPLAELQHTQEAT